MAERARPDAPDERRSLPAAAVEASPIAILMTDESGRIVLVNPAAEELSGYPRAELLEQPIEMLLPERFRERHRKLRESYAAEPRARRMFSEPAIYFLRRDGTEIPVEISLSPIEIRSGVATVSFILDADELKRARSLVSAADQMASIHTLATGVAHGVNNPLSYVMGNLSFALGELERVRAPAREAIEQRRAGDPSLLLHQVLLEIRDALAHAQEGSTRIRDLVIDLLTLSSTPNGEWAAIEIHPVLESALNLAASEIRSRARLVRQFDEVPRVRGDASDLLRVIFNLLTNAVESLPEGESEKNEVRVATWTSLDGSAVVEVRDTGLGIMPETIDRIFDPFFTTKGLGVSAGLGLAVAQGIVKSLDGEIEVTSTPGSGSTFRVKLPAAFSADSPAARPSVERARQRPN